MLDAQPASEASLPDDAAPDAYGCVATSGGVEACDGVDNDCDGTIDGPPADALCGATAGCLHARCVPNFVWDYGVGVSLTFPGDEVVIDDAQNAYFVTTVREMIVAPGVTPQGPGDWLIISLDPFGHERWVRQIGGPGSDTALSIALQDTQLVVGGFFEGDLTVAGRSFHTITPSTDDVLIVALDPATGDERWAHQIASLDSGTRMSRAPRMTVTTSGAVVSASGVSGRANAGGADLGTAGGLSELLVGLDSGGNHVWSRAIALPSSATGAEDVVTIGPDVAVGLGVGLGPVDLGSGTATSGGPIALFRVNPDSGALRDSVRLGADPATALSSLVTNVAGGLCFSGSQAVADFGHASGAHTGYAACVDDTLGLVDSWTIGTSVEITLVPSDEGGVAFIGHNGTAASVSAGRAMVDAGEPFFGQADNAGALEWIRPIDATAMRGAIVGAHRFFVLAFASAPIAWDVTRTRNNSAQVAAFGL